MRKLTLAATQFACGGDSAGNLDKAEALVRRAAAEGADIVLLQELFETPYFCKDQLAGLFALARPPPAIRSSPASRLWRASWESSYPSASSNGPTTPTTIR